MAASEEEAHYTRVLLDAMPAGGMLQRAMLVLETTRGKLLVGLRRFDAEQGEDAESEDAGESPEVLADRLVTEARKQMDAAAKLSYAKHLFTDGDTVWRS